MRVTVLYFAGLRDLVGSRDEEFALEAGARLADLQQAVLARRRDLQPLTRSIRWAINESYAKPDTSLSDGDRIALIPPVSGG